MSANMLVTVLPEVSQHSTWLKAWALENMYVKSATDVTSQGLKSRLNSEAAANIWYMVVTLEVSQPAMFSLKVALLLLQ